MGRGLGVWLVVMGLTACGDDTSSNGDGDPDRRDGAPVDATEPTDTTDPDATANPDDTAVPEPTDAGHRVDDAVPIPNDAAGPPNDAEQSARDAATPVDAVPPADAAVPLMAYGPWDAWGPCEGEQRHRSRSCLENGDAPVDCALCGGACEEAEPCDADCARLGLNVVNCHPQPPGDADTCTGVLQGGRDRCLARGCVWEGPEQCAVGGSVSNGNCFGATAACLDTAEMPSDFEYGPWGPWSHCADGHQTRARECREVGGGSVDCESCGGACEESSPCDVPCAALGINVVNCHPQPPGDLAACNGVLTGAQLRCVQNGCRWQGPDACIVGGSVSNANCFGGTGACLDAEEPPPEYQYGPWGPWSHCAGEQRSHTRACVEVGVGPVDCALCGGACEAFEACQADCAALGINVVNCAPQPPGDQGGCEQVLLDRRTQCLQSGCTWNGPLACVVGGSVSNPNCFGATAACADGAPQVEYVYSPWNPWSDCVNGQRTRQRECLENGVGPTACGLCGGECEETEACQPNCEAFGINVVNCAPQPPGDQGGCEQVLLDRRTLCLQNGCTWNGPLACVVGGSVSNPNCFGATAACADGAPQVEYVYSPWSPWSDCVEGQRARQRECLANGVGPAACDRCGGECQETEACQPNCAPFGINVVNCNPQPPGDQGACEQILLDRRTVCLQNGCTWNGPLACAVGGSVSNPNCFGATAACVQ